MPQIVMDERVLNQAKKGQGETNDRLDKLIKEMQRTNELLAKLVAVNAK